MTGPNAGCRTGNRSTAKHTHLVAKLASGRELRFVDPRRFGRLEVRQTSFSGPGAEPLSIDAEEFARLFHASKAPVKAALLNQKLLHGVGNIYADEALFRAHIRPRRTRQYAYESRVAQAARRVAKSPSCGHRRRRIFSLRLRRC